MNRSGLSPSKRKIKESRPNQWQGSPQQILFLQNYLDPESPTFSNAYRSAKNAGYSEEYSKDILYESPQWIREYQGLSNMKLEHIEQSLIKLASFERDIDSRSPDDTRIKAIELLSKLKGYMIERKQVASVIKVELGKVNQDLDQ
jgi:hypothetical protein